MYINGYKVLINEPRPYMHAGVYRMRYINYYTAYHNQHNPDVLAGTRVYNNDGLTTARHLFQWNVEECRIVTG